MSPKRPHEAPTLFAAAGLEHDAPHPYFNPHVNRPFDLPTSGAPLPDENPLAGVARFADIVRNIQPAVPEMAGVVLVVEEPLAGEATTGAEGATVSTVKEFVFE